MPPHPTPLHKPEISTSGPPSATEGLGTKTPGVSTYQPEIPATTSPRPEISTSGPPPLTASLESKTPDVSSYRVETPFEAPSSPEPIADVPKPIEAASPSPETINPEISPSNFSEVTSDLPPSQPRALRPDEWMLQGEPEARRLRPEEWMLQGTKHVDYQGGRSIWKEAELQLKARFSNAFDSLGNDAKAKEALRTFNIDHIKDEIINHPEKYGLLKNFDGRRLTQDDIINIKWDSAFDRAFPKGLLTDKLSSEQIGHILEVNQENLSSLHHPAPETHVSRELPAPYNVPIVEKSSVPTTSIKTPALTGDSVHDSTFHPTPPPAGIRGGVETTETIPSAPHYELRPEASEELPSYINRIVSQSSLEKESTAHALADLGLTRPEDAAATSHFVATAEFSGLPPETVAKYPDFALSPDLSPRTAASIINLIESDTSSRVREMEIKHSLAYFAQHYRGSVSEGTVSNGPVKKLELFFTPSGSGRQPFEITITKDGFSIGGVRYPLRRLDTFINRPESFIGANW